MKINESERKCSDEIGIIDNQEDSVIMNKSAVQRGLFRATALKKYQSIIEKNQSTSQDDQFMKPTKDKVARMKQEDYYFKLNEKGFAPEETVLNNGDMIIGKVKPVQTNGPNDLPFKDDSEAFKSHVPGAVDKVYSGIYNADGYEMVKIRVRSERIPHIGDKFCLTEDHDVLTEKGWIPIKNVTNDIKVATLKGENIKYEYPVDVYNWKYEGDMYELESKQIDYKATIDHEVYVKKSLKGNFENTSVSEINGKGIWYKKNCVNNLEDLDEVTIGDRKYETSEFIKFLGMYLAEGCINDKKQDVNVYVHKDRIKNKMSEVLDNLGIKYYDDSKSSNRFTMRNKNLYNYFKQFGKAEDKHLPKFVWNMSAKQCSILIDALVLGDGYERSDLKEYYTSSKKLADDFQRLCIHANMGANIREKHPKGEKLTIKGVETIRKNIQYRIGIIRFKTTNEPKINPDKSLVNERITKYKGTVYCLEVPSHVFMIRRNGKHHWTGNCSRHKLTVPKSIP